MRYFGKLRLIFFQGLLCLTFGSAATAQLHDSIIAPPAPALDTTQNIAVTIAEVNITGFKQTKPYIIQREVAFHQGEVISRGEIDKRLELSRQQLMNTSLFVEVDIKPTFITPDVALINVYVKERWYIFPLPYFKMIDRNFNTWWVEHKRSLQRINYGLKFFHNNVSGRNDKLNLWLVGGYTQQASIRYENPFLDKKLRHGMNIGVSYSRNREVNYATSHNKQSFFKNEDDFLVKEVHVDLSYSYRPAVKTRHYFRVSYNDMRIEDTVRKLNPEFFPGTLQRVRFPDVSYNIQYFNVDYIPYPLSGVWGDAYIYKRFGEQNNLWQIGGKGTYTKKVLPKSYVQFQASGMIRFPFDQPYFNMRLLGTSDMYMRGMEYYVIDGVAGGLVRATAIQKVLDVKITNPIKIKTLDKIPLRVYLKAFSDAGYAYNPNPGNSLLNNRLLKSWGFGIDIVSVYDVVLKLEYSFNQMGDRGFFIHSKSDF